MTSSIYFPYSLACIKLEEYQTAKTALEVGASLAPGDSRFNNLIKECDQRIAGTTLLFGIDFNSIMVMSLSMTCF